MNRRKKIKAKAVIATLLILAVMLGLVIVSGLMLVGKIANRLQYTFERYEYQVNVMPVVVDIGWRGFVTRKIKPIPGVLVKTEVVTCEWSRECVEAYIAEVANGDKEYLDWAIFAANVEGGYVSQLAQQNWADSHSDGEKGSFGQFQFGKGTYEDYCEPNANWQMDWRAQTRCSKIIWDRGGNLVHNTWYLTTNKYLKAKGSSTLSYVNE